MRGYKALKEKSKLMLRKKKVVDRKAIKEITDEDGRVVRNAEKEQSHEELQMVQKRFDSNTGEALDDSVKRYELDSVERDLKSLKDRKASEAARYDEEIADLEALLADLKKL